MTACARAVLLNRDCLADFIIVNALSSIDIVAIPFDSGPALISKTRIQSLGTTPANDQLHRRECNL